MKIFLIMLILSTTLGYGQGQNVVISYGLQIEKEKGLFDNNATLKSLLEKSMVDAKKLTFQLIITENGSKFYSEKILDSDDAITSQRFTLAMANYVGIVFSLKEKLLFQKEMLGENIYAEEALKSNWILTSETKLIDNYLCYKATNVFTVRYETKVFNHPVVAWYCPALPYPYGPVGYGNLPGLILELQVRNAVFGAKSIQLNSNLTFDIKSLEKLKILNEKQLEEAYNKLNGF
ncbi:GLPGLI family protein [Flavobacterium sp. CG_9.1]|uniref:GLPGLI family protein n=1 Tax=Flavobacterium sp. CG_9.1 TaxID=2787728 RepID=UPI0018CA7A7D|nr:GLPGLI family protein [Flavobacterium sp. CG_9.1]MBG6060320.1 GLPGLI family protein [Flavobacterium sp. CG_9.1]